MTGPREVRSTLLQYPDRANQPKLAAARAAGKRGEQLKDNRLLEMRVVRAIVEAGGFSAAARQLGVSQAFISQAIHGLEKRLGVKLLHRSTRGHRLTAEGEYYVTEAARITDSVDQFESDFLSLRAQVSGSLRITIPVAFGYDQILPRLPQFMEQHPDIEITVNLNDEVANLIENGFDVAIRMGVMENSTLIRRKLCDLRRLVVAAPSYIAKYGLPDTPTDLSGHNCLMWFGRREHLNRWPFIVDGEQRIIQIAGNFKSTDGLALSNHCLAGCGIMRMAEHLALPYIRQGKLVRLLRSHEFVDQTAIQAVYLPERHPLPRIRAFVDYMVESFKIPPWLSYKL
ncbi:LysR family transcriptional regulator [Gemmobacter sp. 24YEA27]|uniref:LysR family transcriptional regulator n=1 Tax=Gemmobacter sp. 24YEA27 TaxID=3040672 RepID=UPI0024B39BCF|nr:LysR family transcriptional regulator [Gemmobacter sp. 24YEA27]